MLKAILFDMDGVIVDTEPLHKKAYFLMFNAFKIDVSEHLYHSLTGQSTINICKKLVDIFDLNNRPEELAKSKRAFFLDLFNHDPSLQLLDGVLDLIKNFYDNGLTLILASSASIFTIDKVFERFDLNKYFKDKISGAGLKASKPNPEIFEKAAEMAGVTKNECFVIEDSTNGIKAAHSAGIYCIAYKSLHSKGQQYDLANKVISNFKEIYFDKINKEF